MSKISLLINDIKERYTRENFRKIADKLNSSTIPITPIYTTETLPTTGIEFGSTVFNSTTGVLNIYTSDGWVAAPTETVVETEQIGIIKSLSTMVDTPDLDSNWKECDGSLITDADSPYYATRIYNLNGADVTIFATWTADAGGSYATISSGDIAALSIGDSVSGTGISQVSGQDAQITSLDETTRKIIISDTAASGYISSTFTNDGMTLYGGSSSSAADQFQAHEHDMLASLYPDVSGANNIDHADSGGIDYWVYNYNTMLAVTDDSNGPVRTGTRTAGHRRFVKMIMRIK